MNVRKALVLAVMSVSALGMVACDDDDEGPGPEVFVATLNGAQEVPAVTTTATGTARVEFTATGLTFTVNVSGIQNVTLAHIHGPALAGANAGVVLNLNPTLTVTTGVLAQGTATGPGTSAAAVTMDSLKAFIRTGRAYVNVHNTANPGGHIRGQLTAQ